MKVFPFEAVYPNLEKVPHSNHFFDTVKFRYHDYAAEGLFLPTDAPAMYIYQIKEASGRKFTGLILGVDVEEYWVGNLKKHEKTIVSNEDLQAELLQTRGAAIKPVLLGYPSVPALDALLEAYIETHRKFYVIELGSEKHRFWQITEPETTAEIQRLFAEHVPRAYIADGHHRSASFAALSKMKPSARTQKMLCAFFTPEQLRINAFNRILKDLNGVSSQEFLERLRHFFKINVLKAGRRPYIKREITMFLEGQWFLLSWRKRWLKTLPQDRVLLDVDLLNEYVLKPILGVKNIRSDARVVYIDGTKSAENVAQACPTEGVAFCLFPIDFEDLTTIADDNGTLPPKSTFFEPRLKNGLLVYEI